MAPRIERKLAAILAADVVGYSRLVGIDEAGTIARLKALRQESIEPLIAEYHGRVVKLMGDGALVEFASALDAVECAVAIQNRVAEHQAALPEDRRLAFRIGINVGDIIVEDGDILGDGVNIAARLEGLAEPGGICIAQPVHKQIKSKLGVPLEPMGEHRVKNIADPVEVWRVILDGSLPRTASKSRRLAPLAIAAGLAALLVSTGVGMGYWWWTNSGSAESAALPLPDQPSIAVLPFNNLTGDPEQEYFVDGLTEDLITELSRFKPFGVVARNSTFRYKGQAIDVRQVGNELDARYVVEGSVRRSPERIRVAVQLLDAKNGQHVWGETYDRQLTAADVFAIQDEITLSIANTIADAHGILSRELTQKTRRKPIEELSSYECVLRLHEYNRVNTAETHLAALRCLERAVKADPGYSDAWAALAEIYDDSYAMGFNPVENALDKALDAANRAQALDPTSQQAQYAVAYTQFIRRDLNSYLASMDKLWRLNPNNAQWLGTAGWGIAWSGQCEQGRAMFDQAAKLNPYHPGWLHYPFVICHYAKGDHKAALAELQKIDMPDMFWTPMLYAAIYAETGEAQKAHLSLADALRQNPDLAERPRFWIGAYVFPEEFIDKIMDGLRKAGLEAPVTG